MCEVGQFMNHNILNKGWLQHHSAPVEPQRAIRSAASPALALVSDEHRGLLSTAQSWPPTLDAGSQPFLCT